MIMDDKRGILAFNLLAMMPRIIFLVIMLIACTILIRLYVNDKFDIIDIQSEVLVNGFLYGPGGIGYLDPVTGRMYPQIVDLQQLEDGELDEGFYFPENHLITAKISIEKDDPDNPLKEVYFNREWYVNWEPLLAFKNVKGIGGVTDYSRDLPVIIRDETGELRNAQVHMQVVQPKSLRSGKK